MELGCGFYTKVNSFRLFGGLWESVMVMDGRVCEDLTPRYYALCAIGGMLSAGTTHLAITPLDVLKVNMQVLFKSFCSLTRSTNNVLPCFIMGLKLVKWLVSYVLCSDISINWPLILGTYWAPKTNGGIWKVEVGITLPFLYHFCSIIEKNTERLNFLAARLGW